MTRTGRALSRILIRSLVGGFIGLVIIFMIAPLVVIVGASFDGGEHSFINFPPQDLSLRWYWAIPPRFISALQLSFILALASTFVGLLLGIPAALGIVRGTLPGRDFIASIFRTPLQIPVVVAGIAFLQAYYALSAVSGVRLADTFVGLLAGHVFITVPYIVGSVVAVLHRFNMRLEEAAYSLGASKTSTFFRVTLPIIAPGAYTGALYAFITSFGDVPISLFLGGAKFNAFPVEMFTAMQFDFNSTILATSTLIILFSILLMLIAQRLSGVRPAWRKGR